MKVKDGTKLTPTQAGIDFLGVDSGTEFAIREVVKAKDRGAYDDSEDAVVVEWHQGNSVRAVSFGLSMLDDYFEVS